ncbi:S8 family serine peptidase [Halochromatium roseum]|uniref:S8 family serine peptidase n=1 Tax=Halochromatium roseum TaxID=391920 RepID=UPI001913EE3D|nr:S8 family serine peptidase [Halochromatium roseum]MBK5937915.1 hypothetical protein [Halochromatium roseum]
MLPTDTYFPFQWHLLNLGQFGGRPGVDLNVIPVWAEYTGAGVDIGIYDGGTQVEHPDLQPNWDPALQPLIAGLAVDPSPYGWAEFGANAHGTAVAGLAAAARNDIGVVGVAYDANLGVGIYVPSSQAWIDSLSGYIAFEEALNVQRVDYDVTNSSYGPIQPLMVNQAEQLGIEISTLNGRDGLGTVNVIAAGNERWLGRTSTDGGFESMRQSVAVAAGSDQGDITWYSNPGASLLVTAPVDRHPPLEGPLDANQPFRSATTDLLGPDGYSIGNPPEIDLDYTDQMAGTSAAAPMVTGVVALMLQANPALGYRDVQEILALSARANWQRGDYDLDGWQINGADHFNGGGLAFNHDYGFGFVDALAAVRLSETWSEQRTRYNEVSMPDALRLDIDDVPIPDNSGELLSYRFEVTNPFEVEWIELDVDIEHPWWGDLVVSVISPDGTETVLLNRPGVLPEGLPQSVTDFRIEHDETFDPETNLGMKGDGDLQMLFASTASRGESSVGTWTVRVGDLGDGSEASEEAGELDGLSFQLFGNPEGETIETFFYTNRYAELASADSQRQVLATEGEARINAAAVSTDSVIYLEPGIVGQIANTPFMLAADAIVTEVFGGDGADALLAAAWDSTLFGGRGHDWLYGNSGNDLLLGGRGNDHLTGGAGADVFIFHDQNGQDRILDFDPTIDRIEVAQSINGQTLTSVEALIETAFNNTFGEAVLTFGVGQTLTLVGISAEQLTPEPISLV